MLDFLNAESHLDHPVQFSVSRAYLRIIIAENFCAHCLQHKPDACVQEENRRYSNQGLPAYPNVGLAYLGASSSRFVNFEHALPVAWYLHTDFSSPLHSHVVLEQLMFGLRAFFGILFKQHSHL